MFFGDLVWFFLLWAFAVRYQTPRDPSRVVLVSWINSISTNDNRLFSFLGQRLLHSEDSKQSVPCGHTSSPSDRPMTAGYHLNTSLCRKSQYRLTIKILPATCLLMLLPLALCSLQSAGCLRWLWVDVAVVCACIRWPTNRLVICS